MKQRFGDIKPISSQTVFIPNAYLSFDFKGIPFFEPCYSNAIVEYKNDLGGRVAAENEQESKNIIESEFYKRWLWTRCSPGLEYSRELPPVLEVSYILLEEPIADFFSN